MNALIVDTHVFVWLLSKSKQLGPNALEAIKGAASLNSLYVSAITPWEIAMLVSKGKLTLERDVGEWLEMALALPGFRLKALSPAIAVASTRLPGEINSDPADRIIVATARHLGVPLVTADEKLLGYSTQGHIKSVQATK
jgi:PIN domain nuclease of toxin-antitoxin system